MSLSLPAKIDRFEIRAELGRGGMATVYRAFDPRFKREVAIKVLPQQFLHDPNFATRFAAEAQLVAALEHPAIVPVYDFGGLDTQPYLVMRLLTGGSLGDRLKAQGTLPVAESARIMTQLASGLDAAHAKGIIHRDIKPANILFDEYGLSYLVDFGIARLTEATHTMTIIGTPAYMSPEQWQGGQKLDGRVDVYALGVVLFEMLTGTRPYKTDTPAELMFKHVFEPVPDPLSSNPDLPVGYRTVIEKAMAKDRNQRYATAADLATAVNEVAADLSPATNSTADYPATEIIQPDFALSPAGAAATMDAAKPPVQAVAAEPDADPELATLVDKAPDRGAGVLQAAPKHADETIVTDTSGAVVAEAPARAMPPAPEPQLALANRLKRLPTPVLAGGGGLLLIVACLLLALAVGPALFGGGDEPAAAVVVGGEGRTATAQTNATATPRSNSAATIQPTATKTPSPPPTPDPADITATNEAANEARDEGDCTSEALLCIGLVTDVGEIDDKSFNQSAWEGVQRAEAEMGAKIDFIETQAATDYAANIGLFADNGYDIIVTVGFALGEATLEAAATYPDVHFVGVDQFQGAEIANVTGLIFNEDRSGFLAGALAALLSESGTIAAVLGTNLVPPVVAFKEGYENGALYINPDINFISTYHPGGLDNAFTDPEWGAATAAQAMDQGADVVFGAGGKTGNGALIEVAGREGVYCIGVDSDQWETVPEAHSCLVSSAMKLIAPGVFDIITAVVDGNAPAGNYFGDVGLAPFHDFDSVISDDIKAQLDEIGAGLVDGSIATGYPAD